MKKAAKSLAALGCALVLMGASAVVSSIVTTRSLKPQDTEPETQSVKLVVSGQDYSAPDEITAKPYSTGGTVYLPLQIVGDALGKSVEWDSETNTVYLGKAPMAEDAEQLITILEESHPFFALNAAPDGTETTKDEFWQTYQAAKDEFLEISENPDCTLADFTWAAMAYMASLQDEHTRLDPFGGMPQPALDIGWVADGDHLYLTDEKGAVTDTEVLNVGGLPTKDLFAVIDRYVACENQSGRDLNHAGWAASPSLLMKAGAVFSDDNTLELTIAKDNTSSAQAVGLTTPESNEQSAVISTETIGDVFYIDFNQCVYNDEMQQAADKLKEAVQSGTAKVIIDVRGNGGGNSQTCELLLQAMNMEAPNYGMYVRYSPLAQGTYPSQYDKDNGGDRYDPHPETAKINPDIKLVVLTDESTFSSATMMAVFVRDGKLGTLIGRPSSNKPNHYGDILQFQLNNTNTDCRVSHKQWLRPDQSAEGDELTPDIVTAIGEDALQTAFHYLAD